jgi:hypothetical protein
MAATSGRAAYRCTARDVGSMRVGACDPEQLVFIMDFNSRLQFGRFMCQSLRQLKGTWKGVTEKFRTRFSVAPRAFLGHAVRGFGAHRARFNVNEQGIGSQETYV